MVNDGPAVGAMWQGEYLLQAALGDPTHGVFRAQRRRDAQTVALRLWRAPTDLLASLFLEHASAACATRHPALAQVEACGREEHFCFLVSEYVVGQKLDTWADQVGIPPLAEVIELMRRLCEGLQLAARSGVLHSALHPRNLVMLQAESAANRRQQPKLLDLGVPSFARTRQPHAAAAQFMAPELLTCVLEPGEPALPAMSATMNVYSCGALLYYLCTGGPPFRQTDLSALHDAQLQGRLVLPSRINPQITPSLNAVIVQALALDPKQRFSSVSELGEALARVSLSPSVESARPVLSQPPLVRPGPVPPPKPASSRASAIGLRRISPPAISLPPGMARRPPTAAGNFEPEAETARTGVSAAPRVMIAGLGSSEGSTAERDPASVPAGSFSSVPPSHSSHPPKPPQAVLATPLALFTGSPAMHAAAEPPAKPPARLDPNAPQLLGSHDRISTPALPEDKPSVPVVWLGALAAVACMGLFLMMRMLDGGAPPISEQTPTVTIERPATDAPPLQPEMRASAPSTTAPVAPPVIVQEPVHPPPEPPAAREQAPLPRSSRRSSRTTGNASGAVIATRESHSSGSSTAADAAPRNPEPTLAPQAEAVPSPADSSPSTFEVLLPLPKLQSHNGEAAAVATRSAEPNVVPAPARPDSMRPLEARAGIEEVTIRGSLPTSWVRRAAERIRPQLSVCYAQAAQAAGRNLFGALTVELEFDERGRARNPRARGSGLAGLNDCVAEAAGKVICQRAPDTGTVHASFKVIFSP